jgi:hypothetical protein
VDPRIEPGDDEKGGVSGQMLLPLDPYPDAYADPPGRDRGPCPGTTARKQKRIRLPRLARRVELLDRLRIQFDFRGLHKLRELL